MIQIKQELNARMRDHRVVLLSSKGSTYGACILRAAMGCGLKIDAVVVEANKGRGGIHRFKYYCRKYGWSTSIFRLLETVMCRISGHLTDNLKNESIESAATLCGVPLKYIDRLSSSFALETIEELNPTIGLQGGAGIVHSTVIGLFPLGILHAHPGLLPQCRGNYPIRWAILKGVQTGATVLLLDAGLDTGPTVKKIFVLRRYHESLWNFEERVSNICAQILPKTAKQYLSGKLKPQPQPPYEGETYGLMSVRDTIRVYRKLRNQDRKNGPYAR